MPPRTSEYHVPFAPCRVIMPTTFTQCSSAVRVETVQRAHRSKLIPDILETTEDFMLEPREGPLLPSTALEEARHPELSARSQKSWRAVLCLIFARALLPLFVGVTFVADETIFLSAFQFLNCAALLLKNCFVTRTQL